MPNRKIVSIEHDDVDERDDKRETRRRGCGRRDERANRLSASGGGVWSAGRSFRFVPATTTRRLLRATMFVAPAGRPPSSSLVARRPAVRYSLARSSASVGPLRVARPPPTTGGAGERHRRRGRRPRARGGGRRAATTTRGESADERRRQATATSGGGGESKAKKVESETLGVGDSSSSRRRLDTY